MCPRLRIKSLYLPAVLLSTTKCYNSKLMAENLSQQPEEEGRAGNPKVLVLSTENSAVSQLLDNASFLLNIRNVASFKRGRWGYTDEVPLTREKAKNLIITTRPDVIIIADPLEGRKAANFMSLVPKINGRGTPLPAAIGIFDKFPQEISEPLGLSRFFGGPFRDLHLSDRRIPIPGYLGTVMDQLDARVVFSEEAKKAWEQYYPEEYKVISMEDLIEGTRQFIDYVNEVLENHGRPDISSWEPKPRRNFLQRRDHELKGRFGRKI